MSNGSAPSRRPESPRRFVPSGVDAQSWMGFEQRIQERRYHALLDVMKAALAAGDAVAARAALEEARELRPTASALDAYELRISAIPLVPSPSATPGVGQWRAASAVAMLLVGISFLTGIDYLRSQPSRADEPSAPASMSAAPVAADVVALDPFVPLSPAPPPAAPAIAAANAPRGTAGRVEFERAEEIAIPAALRPLRTVDTPPAPPHEVADDFVYPSAIAAPVALLPRVPAVDVMPRTPAVVTIPPPATAAPPAAGAAAAARLEESRVSDVLNAYARAYERLDASAARAVWPTVNERALARAFASLESQRVSFDNCEIALHGTTANALCRGQASYVGKVGSREPRQESRQWMFELRQEDAGWKIQNAEARRP